MGKFSEEDIKELEKNKYVKRVSSTNISYTDEFKKLFIEESKKGKGPTRIFIESGFNPYILGSNRIRLFSVLYKNKNKKNELLVDNRGKVAKGRPKKSTKILTPEEEIEQLKHENIMLKAENDLLKKMGFLVNQKEQKKSQLKKDIK